MIGLWARITTGQFAKTRNRPGSRGLAILMKYLWRLQDKLCLMSNQQVFRTVRYHHARLRVAGDGFHRGRAPVA